MIQSRNLIQNTKKKFLIYSALGVFLVVVVSFMSLSFHVQNVKKQNSIQTLHSLINTQLDLLNKVSLLSEKYDDNLYKNEVDQINQDIKSHLVSLESINNKIKSLFKTNTGEVATEVKDSFADNKVDYQMQLFLKTSRELLSQKNLTKKDVQNNIRYLSFTAREGLGDFLTILSRSLQKKQIKSMDIFYKMGFVLVGFCILQVALVWGMVFKPLYTTILKQHQKIVDAVYKADSASRSKTDFLANISHEIRTPMTAILGYADVLKREGISKSDKDDAVNIIDQNASHLLALIDEILDISKIEAGKFDYENEKVNLVSFLNEVYSLINVKSKDKGIQLIFKNDGKIPENIMVDPKRLKQILYNILGNAIKFTDEGYVELVASYDQDINKVSLQVIDTGVGISDEQQKKLFKPFEQADTSVRRRFGGTGLGLVLARELARGMGGDVKILSSTVGSGTTFEILIDAGQVEESQLVDSFSTNVVPESPVEEIDDSKLSNAKILVVDDAKENARLFKLYLSEAGADVEVANDGQTALDITKNKFFDVVLLDLQMPGKDGFQVIRELKNRAFHKPVIALTAHAMKEEKQKTKEAGFYDHITKPVKANDLINSVAKSIKYSTFRNS